MDAIAAMHEAISRQDFTRMQELLNASTFAGLLGIEIVELREGYAKAVMRARDDMQNHFSTIHGGAGAALADHAFAGACNTLGRPCVGLQLSVNYLSASKPGDQLTAEAWVRHSGGRVATMEIRVTNERHEVISTCTGIGYYLNRRDTGESQPVDGGKPPQRS